MKDLIKHIEAADGPDRELDALIWCALNGKKYVGWFDPYGEEGRATAVEYTAPPKRTRLVTHSKDHAPLYTSSIDAAMTLVPECDAWKVMKGGRLYSAIIYIGSKSFDGYAKSPALALCAAAMKAFDG